MTCSAIKITVWRETSVSSWVAGIAGIIAMVSVRHKNNFILAGMVFDPKPNIVMTNADTLEKGRIKSARY
jgi:hypothetical protein